VTVPDAPTGTFDNIEISLTVSDIDASREYYREFVGLTELPPAKDPIFQTKNTRFATAARLSDCAASVKKYWKNTGHPLFLCFFSLNP
jgi:hypothetical protein